MGKILDFGDKRTKKERSGRNEKRKKKKEKMVCKYVRAKCD